MSNLNYLVEDRQNKWERDVQNILTENRTWKDRYPSLMESLGSGNKRVSDMAKNTVIVMENQRAYIEGLAKQHILESTFTGNLGQLIPKLIDVVRIFYPNLVAQYLTDIQPLDRMTGDIFVVRPVYTNTAAGVTAGEQVFKDITDGTYASEITTAALGTVGDNTTTTFTGTMAVKPIRPSTVVVKAGAVTLTDTGTGALVSATDASTGTVDYETGAISVTFATAPATGVQPTVTYNYNSEAAPDNIRSVDIRMTTIPVTASPHPLRVSWSTQAQLAASAHLNLDIPDILANLAASFIKQERDVLLINDIINATTADTNLNFDASAPTNYSRLAKYAEIGLKLNYAESTIQKNMGRGGISWVLCGNNAADIWRNAADFVPSDVVAPIGAHHIGTLRDGTVNVIKAPFMDSNTYVVGFKGYVVGDSAAILAEWIPLYATPVFQSPDLNNYQGMMSLYSLFINNPEYYLKGTISNYAA